MPNRPKPTAIKLLTGNPGHRPLNKREPKPRVRLPSPPSHLDAIAKAEWRRMGKLLVGVGVMTEIDGTGLAAYCTAYSTWVQARQNIEQYGMVILSPKEKFPIQSPYLSIANKAFDQMVRLLSEFGALPASRTRVQMTAEPDRRSADPMAEFLA